MSAHGQTITWGLHIGKSTQDAQGHWLQRIGQRCVRQSKSHGEALRMTLDRVWDSRRERFRPSQAGSVLDQATERGGQSWLITVHSAAL
jgi:ABC-type transporter Mla maintaining outer membrane lipid asymmetry permease subunit MlaE